MTTPPKMRRVAENDYEIGEPPIRPPLRCSAALRRRSRPTLCVPVETQRIGNSHLRKVSVSESNVLLDEEVLTDPKIQALLLTVLVRTCSSRWRGVDFSLWLTPVLLLQATQVKYSTDDFDQRILYEYLAEASVVFPKVFPVV